MMINYRGVVRPDRSAAEIVLKVGNQASIMLDIDETNDGPPVLCMQGENIQVLVYPHGWLELGEVHECDLLRFKELAEAVAAIREVIAHKLAMQKADRAANASEDVDEPGEAPNVDASDGSDAEP